MTIETDAIATVIEAMEPLDIDARNRVFWYAYEALRIDCPTSASTSETKADDHESEVKSVQRPKRVRGPNITAEERATVDSEIIKPEKRKNASAKFDELRRKYPLGHRKLQEVFDRAPRNADFDTREIAARTGRAWDGAQNMCRLLAHDGAFQQVGGGGPYPVKYVIVPTGHVYAKGAK